MYLAIALVCTAIVLLYTFYIRKSDLPVVAAEPAYKHLEGRKAAIYENLRDLQFEYRVGKLSDEDYSRTKLELQAELAGVLEEIDRLMSAPASAAPVAAAPAASAVAGEGAVCPHCKARFDRPLKFCGECGKPMGATA
jgi:hypothetical protein